MADVKTLKQALKELRMEYGKMRELAADKRKAFGEELNARREEILEQIRQAEQEMGATEVAALDVTAPAAANQAVPEVWLGSKHPLMTELDRVIEIYSRMGFEVVESRQLDDEFHMFESLNFPAGHPARDGYDTFRTEEGFIPPAHTSTMQYRVLQRFRGRLAECSCAEECGCRRDGKCTCDKGAERSGGVGNGVRGGGCRCEGCRGGQIAVVVPGRTFRNEDVDATHEHTFYQCEGVYVAKDATMGQMLGVLRSFFEAYYEQELRVRTQPGYFPFTEPSLEFMIEKPAALGGKGDGWLEMLGCGMIHPNVLRTAGIDPEVYKGFAWGGGIDRLVMLKYRLNDIRYFESGKLAFLEEF